QCGAGMELGCNDDDANGIHSQVDVPVTGGQTVYVVVDSWDSMSGGAYKLNVALRADTGVAPTLTKAEFILNDGSTTDGFIYFTATDADADASRVYVTWKDTSGNPAGSAAGGVTFPAPGMSVSGLPLVGLSLDLGGGTTAASFDLQLVDTVNHKSAVVNVPPLA